MGAVYSALAVQRQRIPVLSSYDIVVSHIREQLVASDAIVSAVVCGSVLRGDHTIRSDIDVVVIMQYGQELPATETMQQCVRFAAERFIEVNFVPVDDQLSRTNMHHLGPSFLWHVTSALSVGGLVKGTPLPLLSETQSMHDDARSYLRTKAYSLQANLTELPAMTHERRLAFFKKVLESPLHVARKWATMRDVLDDDSKEAVRMAFEAYGPPELRKTFASAIVLDSWYTMELEAAVRNFDGQHYKRVLQRLVEGAPAVVLFARDLALACAR